jgi:hypothetical protein
MESGIRPLMALAAVVVLIGACSGGVAENAPADQTTEAIAQLRADLESGGAHVEAGGTVTQVFFAPEAQVMKVDGQDVQVFEFATHDEAVSTTSLISADGGSIGTTMVTWVASPHFYHEGKLIALYVGDDTGVLDALEAALGIQIAGR